MTLIKHKDKF